MPGVVTNLFLPTTELRKQVFETLIFAHMLRREREEGRRQPRSWKIGCESTRFGEVLSSCAFVSQIWDMSNFVCGLPTVLVPLSGLRSPDTLSILLLAAALQFNETVSSGTFELATCNIFKPLVKQHKAKASTKLKPKVQDMLHRLAKPEWWSFCKCHAWLSGMKWKVRALSWSPSAKCNLRYCPFPVWLTTFLNPFTLQCPDIENVSEFQGTEFLGTHCARTPL